MRTEKRGRYKRVIIEPGEYFSCGNATVISTLLGSCVACCLYDPVHRIIGMNHFMLSAVRHAPDPSGYISEAGRYGVNAMELLINDMMSKGAGRHLLRAKVFGGASIFRYSDHTGGFLCVGEGNCNFIRQFLADERIPLEAEDLGGDHGRVIHFSNGDFTVYRRRIGLHKSQQLAVRDRECWRHAISRQEKSMPSVELWHIAETREQCHAR